MSDSAAGPRTGTGPVAAPVVPFAAVVVAAGAGTRFGADRPKALLDLAGQPLVRHAAAAMIAAGATRLVVVIPEGWSGRFAEALDGLAVDHLVAGGAERTQSVRNGLAALDRGPDGSGPDPGGAPSVVLIQDAARPLVPTAVTHRVVAAVAAGAAAVVPAVPVTDTIRELVGGTSRTLDRSRLRAVQTPQGFDLAVLRDAYAGIGDDVITDDAGVCERAGHRVRVVDGAPESFKITHPADLALAELIMDRAAASGVTR
jgi:2-C-methyl-D-erythritol 4-phosphate cytidylyltransferase